MKNRPQFLNCFFCLNIQTLDNNNFPRTIARNFHRAVGKFQNTPAVKWGIPALSKCNGALFTNNSSSMRRPKLSTYYITNIQIFSSNLSTDFSNNLFCKVLPLLE